MFVIEGSGKIESRERPISSFIKLHTSINGNIEIIQSDEERVVVECDDNLQDYIEVVNAGRTLYVTENSGIRKAKFTHILVQVYLRQIDAIVCNMRGNLSCKNEIQASSPLSIEINAQGNTSLRVKAPSIKSVIRCQGDVELSGSCDEASFKTMMQGNLMARNLIARKISLKNMSEGNTEIYGSEEIVIRHMGQGYVHYYGAGRLKDVNVLGEGKVIHKND